MSPDYHAWTHRPKVFGGTDPLRPVDWARIRRVDDTDITVPNQTNTVIGGTASEDFVSNAAIFQINSSLEIEVKLDAFVSLYGQSYWGTYFTAWRQVSVFDVAPAVDYPIAMSGSASPDYDPVTISGIVRVSAGAKLRLVVHQVSGGGYTIYGGGTDIDETNFLEVHFLGEWVHQPPPP